MPIFLILVSNSVHRSQWTTRALGIVLFIHYERYLIIVIALPPLHSPHSPLPHPKLSQHWRFQHLEFLITELDGVEGAVLTGDKDSAIADCGADFEADILIREKDDIVCVPNP